MIKKTKKYFLVLFIFFSSFIWAKDIYWYKDVFEARDVAKKEKKNLFLFFTCLDNCPWSKKFNEEILKNSIFIEKTNALFVFVLVDFPSASNEKLKENKELKEKYKIGTFPSVLLLDLNDDIITKLEYLPLEPQKYALKLEQIVNEYNELTKCDFKNLSGDELKKTYERAKAIGCTTLKMKTIEEGVKKQEDLFFHLEKYSLLVENNKKDEANKLKKEIIDSDPKNLKKSYLKLAMIDFQNLATSDVQDPEKIIKPLTDYIKGFGKKDKENLWRLEMMISQFFSSKGLLKEALKHARASYKAAPLIVRKELAQTIIYLKKKIEQEFDDVTSENDE